MINFDFLTVTALFGIRLFLGSYLTGIVLTNSLSLFTLSIINQIVLSKKISIFCDNSITDDIKVKRNLLDNYSSRELNYLFGFSTFCSITILLVWSIQWLSVGVTGIIFSFINFSSICFLIIFSIEIHIIQKLKTLYHGQNIQKCFFQ